MQSVLAWNMHDLTSARVVFMVIVWSLYFGQLVTDDIDQLQKNVEEAKQQLQLYDDTLGKFFSCTCLLYTSPSPRDRQLIDVISH